jgi:uncharacterized protein (TIGR03083 family)
MTAVTHGPQASIAAWDQSLDATICLGDALTHEQWAAQTECPEWTVKDVYSHLVGGEIWMAEGHPPPSERPATIVAGPVMQRRDADPRAVLAELREVFSLRRRQLADEPPDGDQPAFTAWGAPVTLDVLLRMRAFDAWVHEQDIRRAVGAPGNLSTAGAQVAYMIMVGALPRVVAKLSGAPPGSTVRLAVDGPVAFDDLITVDDAGRGHVKAGAGATVEATVSLHTDWETFSRLAAGRITPDPAVVSLTGDRDLGERILAHIAITP